MSSIQEATTLLEQSLRTRRSLLGSRTTGVTRESLARLTKTPAPQPPQPSASETAPRQISNPKSEISRSAQLAALNETVRACRQCEHLAAFRTQTVFGTGNPNADLMFVGEAPGADEDKQGQPFVGPAGELLTKIITAMGLTRDDVYIANVLKCRPDMPKGSIGNRPPNAEEMQRCLAYLREQIAIIQPRILVALGKTAMTGLTGADEPMGAMRGRWFTFENIPLIPTYHPSYLLRNGSLAEKRKVWEDMMLVMEKLGLPISEKQRGFFRSAS
jgi:DNA polymerase